MASGKARSSNTARNSKSKPRGKPFVKNDVRINRRGRPKNHDELRKLIQQIAAESDDGTPDWSRIERMIRGMLSSRSPVDRIQILEHGWGKVKDETEHTGKVILEIVERTETDDSDSKGAPKAA